jgi:nucleoside-diphosphate-sugar epimerase
MSKTISIIGCGWLGLPLSAFLVEKRFAVKGSTTRSEKLSLLKKNGITPFQIKIGDTLEGKNIDLFFQSEILIINIPPGRRRSNVENIHPNEIKNLIEAAALGDVKKVVFVSSTGVYGNSNNIITEQEPPNPISSSGKALFQIEKFLQKDKRFQTTILRMAGLVGGDRKAGQFLAGKKNVQNGAAPVNLVHRDDCIEIIYQVIKQELWNEVFNVCSDGHPTRKDFYIKQAKKQGFEPPQFAEGDESSFKIVSNEKLKKALNYTFLHPDPMQF